MSLKETCGKVNYINIFIGAIDCTSLEGNWGLGSLVGAWYNEIR